jgi:hypothetical protein
MEQKYTPVRAEKGALDRYRILETSFGSGGGSEHDARGACVWLRTA